MERIGFHIKCHGWRLIPLGFSMHQRPPKDPLTNQHRKKRKLAAAIPSASDVGGSEEDQAAICGGSNDGTDFGEWSQ